MSINEFDISEIDAILRQKELNELEIKKIVATIEPTLKKLTRTQILNPVILKVKLAKIDRKYRDAVYALFRIALTYGPKGSFMVLDPKKVDYIINEINKS